ncbi:MAG TPA: AAA domain-containing protein [Ktedonobacterales bacterium]|nr:AAA domain-containing protein [Ktedonobacterales bacterium]
MTEMSVTEAHVLARPKLLQVFRYLQALHQLRNPIQREITSQPWLLWLHDLPDHPCIRQGLVTDTFNAQESSESEDVADSHRDEASAADAFILKVSRPRLTDPPEPPPEIVPWLQPGWRQVDSSVTIQSSIVDPESASEPDGERRLLAFDADVQRQHLLERWKAARDAWAEAERPARRAMTIFERLYTLHAQLGREAERLELLLGDGVLTWQHSSGVQVHHPVLLLRLQLSFNPDIPEFTLAEADYSPELYTALFRALADVQAEAIASSREDLERGGWHPLGGQETDDFLRRLVARLSPYGRFANESVPDDVAHIPSISRDPVIFVRHRTLGFGVALESILEDLPKREDLPFSLTGIVGIDTPQPEESDALALVSAADAPNGEDEDVLLSKSANAEQVDIARRLERYGAVLVQGPPGTGKTHTIANLVGHLLAQGKSVLVTSHTAKALKVLRDQVVEPLQPLCVSVLDDDGKQMENAVDEITERLAFSDAEALEREAAALLRQRTDLLRELRETREHLKAARADEYLPVLLHEEQLAPSQAARQIAEQRARAGWIPAPVAPGETLLLSAGELAELYRSNALVSAADERELALALPDPQRLLPPGDFERLVAEREHLPQQQAEQRRDLWDAPPADQPPEELEAIQQRILQAVEPLRDETRWRLAALEAGRQGGPTRQAWDDLLAEIEQAHALATQAQPLLLHYVPTIPDDCLPDRIEQVLDDLWGYLKTGGKLSAVKLMTRRDWKTVIERAQVKRRPPELPEHFEALRSLVRLQSARADLVDRWQRQMVPLGAPDAATLGAEPERALHQYVPLLRRCLDWFPTTWQPLEEGLIKQGFHLEDFLAEMPINLAEHGDLLRLREAALHHLPAILAAEVQRRAQAHQEAQLLELRRCLELCGGSAAQAAVVRQAWAAVEQLDASAYREAFERLADLETRREVLARRLALLTNLETNAPTWAAAVRDRAGQHSEPELPGDPAEAWKWRQLDDELERRAKRSLEELQARIAQLSRSLQQTTALLVEQKAWAAQVRRTTPEQQRALQGWKQLMQKAGKGKGKRAPRLLAEARKLMPICQASVPVWIMPLSRVVENFDPQRNQFDVVIIDEASQADLMALVAVYMSRQVVVVGDHEQVNPVAVGQRLDEVQQLIDEHLVGIPNAMLYDGQCSIYDLAQTTFKPVCLREHFRCVSPIIAFSNQLSYDGKIKPLRDASEIKRRPHVLAYRVEHASSSEKVNDEEALTVASLLVAATEQPEYEGATFGVISMVGEEQAVRIETLLQRYLSPAEYTRRRIQCGNAAQFQGDERDVIFLSMVDAPSGVGPLPLRLDGPGKLFKKRFNVATSRARDQLWVVHSLDPDVDLKPNDIRRRLIQFASSQGNHQRVADQSEYSEQSELEQRVMQMLTQAGYRVKSRWPVGSNHIDLVVEGAGKRLAIECDGDRWYPEVHLAADMTRQAILERLGWRFVRIRGSQFFRDPERTLDALLVRLRALGIPPEGSQANASTLEEDDAALQARITGRAAALRQEWAVLRAEEEPQPGPSAHRWGQPWRRNIVVDADPEPVYEEDELPALPQWLPPPHVPQLNLVVQAQPALLPAPAPSLPPARVLPESAPFSTDEGEYQEPLFFPGDAARHARYGVGRVVSSRMIGDFELVEVEFASPFGRQMLEAKLTGLEKVPGERR